MSDTQQTENFRDTINWEEIYKSDLLKSLKRRRMAFVVPGVIFCALAFAVLWTIQNYIPELSNMQVIGWVNFQFLYTMLLFPIIWFAGFSYTRYASKVLEPIEQEIHDKYTSREVHDG